MTLTRSEIIAQISASREAHITAIQGIDPHLVVHPDSGWTVKDLIAHISAWELETVHALRALRRGETYGILDFDLDDSDAFNQRCYERDCLLPWELVVSRWFVVRADLETAIWRLGDEQLAGEMLSHYGSGRMNSVLAYITGIEDHEKEHFEEIYAAKRAALR